MNQYTTEFLETSELKPKMRRLMQITRSILLGATVLFAADYAGIPARAQSAKTPVVLNEADRALVAGSRNAIVRTGVSEGYFDRHFTMVKVVNQPGDRRIVWKFTVNEYSVNVSDVLGYYTANGKRHDTHSVTTTLGRTAEIKRTISRKTADRIIQRCIGSFTNPSVEYRASDNGRARLLLTAEAIPRLSALQKEDPRPNPPKAQVPTDRDVIRDKPKNRPPIIVASIDLESGKCTKGELLAGPSAPTSQF